MKLQQKKILMIGAHPDDCEIKAGATAFLLSTQGHHVKFLSATDGSAGHHALWGPPLAQRRSHETAEAAKVLKVESEIWDVADGTIEPTLQFRYKMIRKIREFGPDVIITHRPNDYHPDHRYTGVLVQDACYMVCVPGVLPECPSLEKNPVVLYFEDKFSKPCPFSYDIVVDVEKIVDVKFEALSKHVSQFFEWLPWIEKIDPPKDKEGLKKWLMNGWYTKVTEKLKHKLRENFDGDFVDKLKHFEAFEISEYGSAFCKWEIEQLFGQKIFK